MAFCAVSIENLKSLTALVHTKIRRNPAALKNLKDFTQELVNFFVSKNVEIEKALAMASYIPQIIREFNADREDSKFLRAAGVSMDAIQDAEEVFDDYKRLAAYVGLKNESIPIVVVNQNQLDQEAKLTKHIQDTKVTFEGDVRLINGKKYTTRVTSIAKVGFEEKFDQEERSPALKHGNTVDAISKAIFDNTNPKFEDFKDLIDPQAFDTLVAKLKVIKSAMEKQGFIFKTAVTVYNKSLGISGEIDLVAINPEGQAYIMDFKTAKQRFNETYLKNETLTYRSEKVSHSVGILSKWKQYGTQGYIYGQLLSEQLGIDPVKKTGIIGININYDDTKITKVIDTEIHNILFSEIREELKDKNVQQLFDEYKKMEGESLGSVEEITEKKPTRRTLRKLDRIAAINEAAASDPQLKQEVDWFNSNPIGKDTLLRVSNVVNAGIFGRWTLDGITIFKNASRGTVYHEGWHRFSQVFMSPAQKDVLYASVQKDNIKFRTRDGRNINSSTASFLDVEEFLAEEFAKYGLNPSQYKYPTTNPEPKTLFQRIWDFLQRYFGSNPRPIELFQKLYSGRISEYKPSVNNAFWGNLNSMAENSKGEEIISNERFPLYVRSMDYLIGKQLRDSHKSFTAFKQSKKLQSTVLNNIFVILETKRYDDPTTSQQQKDEIDAILANERDFTKAYLTSTEYDTLKDFVVKEEVFTMSTEEIAAMEDISERYEDVEDYDESEDNDSRPERFDRSGNEDSAFSIADDAIQDFYRTIPKIKDIQIDSLGNKHFTYELNELGFPENHKFYDIYYRAKRLLSDSANMTDLLEAMSNKSNQQNFPELSIINDFIKPFIENPTENNFLRSVQNVQFVQAFWHNMTMPEVSNMQLTLNYLPLSRDYVTSASTMVSYRTASRSLTLKIIKTWEKDFKDRRNKIYADFKSWEDNSKKGATTPLYLTEDGKLFLNPFVDYTQKYNSSLEGIRSFWQVMGVTFNPKVFKNADAVKELLKIKNTLTKNISIYRDSIISDFTANARMIFAEVGIKAKDTSNAENVIEAMPALMMDIYAKAYYIGNPVSFFNEKREYKSKERDSSFTSPMRFLYEDLSALEEKFGDRVSSGSFRIEDKTKYPYYVLSQILRITREINKIDRTVNFGENINLATIDPLKNKWMKRSYFMKKLFDHNGARMLDKEGNPVKVIIEDIASVRTMTEDENGRVSVLEKSPKSLNTDEKFFMDILTLFKAGAIEIPRAESSSTMFTIRLSDYGKGKNLPILVEEGLSREGRVVPEVFHSIVKDYFAAEIEKRQWFMANDPETKGANKKPLADQFNIFEGILPQELKDEIVKVLTVDTDLGIAYSTPEEIFAIEGLEAKFRDAIDAYFKKLIDEIRPRLDGVGTGLSDDQKIMLKDAIGSKALPNMLSVARAFVMNQFILSQEYYNLYFGDLYFYKNSIKRGKYSTNTGTAFEVDDYRNKMLNDIQNISMHSIFTGKKTGGKDFRYISTSIIEDVEMKSAYVNEDDSKNMLLQGILSARLDSGTLAPNTPEYAKFLADTKANLEKYNSINIADGQGIIGMDFYRNFSIIINIWGEKKENEYQRQKAIFRNHYDLYFKLDEKGNKIRMEGEELEAARTEDKNMRKLKPFAYFNPLKISYTGPQVKDGPTRPVFDKFSVRPVFPEMAIGKRDEGLMLEMAKKDIDYVKFRSGTKVYQDSSFEWYNKIADGEYDLNDFKTEEIEPNQLLAGYLKHQLSTEGFKDENIFGSQFRKIVFGIKYSPLVRNNPALLKKFTGLENKAIATINDLIQVEQNDLFSLLGVKEHKGEFHVDDMKRFLNLLQTESIKRGVAINNIQYIQYDEITKGARFPIDYAFNRQQIQDLLAGLIDDRLRRLKVNGASMIQVSSAGNENKKKFTNATDDDIKKYGTTGLHYYHMIYDKNGKPIRTSTMGVKVALFGEYRNLLYLDAPVSLGISDQNIQIEDKMIELAKDASGATLYTAGKIWQEGMTEEEALKRLNLALKDPEWKAEHMDKLRLIGYRIPTQNNNFIDNMEIMEFLPSSAGSIIIPPIEIIIKSGSDFDIDKMHVIRPSIDKKSQLIRIPKESLAEISNAIANLVYTEREIKALKKQLKNTLNSINQDIEDWESIQRKIRLTMLDLSMKANVSTAITDAMMERIINRESSILPTQEFLEVEEKAFTDEDISDPAFELERATQDLQRLDQEIQNFLEKKEGIKKEKGKVEGPDMKWFNKKKEYKNGKNNELISILSETMSHPYYFELLVTPSSASMFESYTNELMASQENMTDQQYKAALRETQNKLYDRTLTPQQASTYTAMLTGFDNLLSKKKDLGAYAIQRTFADIFNFVGFSIAKEHTINIGGNNYETKVLHLPLVSPSDRSKIIQNGRLLMHGDSVTGIPISRAFDELISLTVDLSNSPAYAFMGINMHNKKHVQYLLHQKTDPKQVLWFMNQPILKELFKHYEEKRRKVSGYSLKHAIVELSLKNKILDNPSMYESGDKLKYEVYHFDKAEDDIDVDGTVLSYGERTMNPKKANPYLSRPYYDLNKTLSETDNFTFEELDKSIRSPQVIQKLINNYFGTTTDSKKTLSAKFYSLEENNPEREVIQKILDEIKRIEKIEKVKQGKILAYFASITEEADWVMKVQFAENMDTTKYATLTSLIRNENNRRAIRTDTTLFDHSQLDRIEKESMISPFDYTYKAKSILKTLFPKLYTPRTIGSFARLASDINGAKNIQIERISKIIENDYIEYIYKNYGTYQGQNLSEKFQKEIINLDATEDHQYFAYKLNAIKAKYPELLDIPFVDRLAEDVYFPPDKEREESYKGLDNKEIHNLFFQRNPDNPTFEKNIFTNNWRDLINFDPEVFSLKEVYTAENIKEISEFFHELVYFSLYQSGLTNTGNGFSDLIPYEYWTTFIEQAFNAYEEDKAKNDGLEVEMLREFEYRFRQMNPKINWRSKDRLLEDWNKETGRQKSEPLEFYNNYYRGKDYKITDDDLLLARNIFARPDDNMKGTVTLGSARKTPNQTEFVPGRYVEYEGVKYILVQEFSPGVWQLYNPLLSGYDAKTIVRQNNLTSLKETGQVVLYGQKVFIVTTNKEIIDLNKNKILKLASTDQNRINILKIAEEQKKPPLPPTDGTVGPADSPAISPEC